MVPFQFKETALAECIDDGWPPIVCVDRGRFLCAVGLRWIGENRRLLGTFFSANDSKKYR